MRKTIEILLLIVTILLFGTAVISCRRNEARVQSAAAEYLSRGFSCNVRLTLDGKTYAGLLSRPSAERCDLAFTQPSELSSLAFSLDSGRLTVRYAGVTATVNPSSIPQSAFVSAMLGAFNAAAAKGAHASLSGSGVRVTGSTSAGAYTLSLGRDLTPKELDLPGLGLKADFSSFKYL